MRNYLCRCVYIIGRWSACPFEIIEGAIPKKGRIYDIGCGVGLLSNHMALRSGDRDVTGIDLFEDRIGVARKSICGRKNVSFEKGDIVAYDFSNPGAIVASDVFHHMPFSEQRYLLKRIYDAIGMERELIIQEIDIKPYFKHLFSLFVDKMVNRMAPVYYSTAKEFEKMLAGAGFEVKIKRIDKGYPIPAVLFKCKKGKRNVRMRRKK